LELCVARNGKTQASVHVDELVLGNNAVSGLGVKLSHELHVSVSVVVSAGYDTWHMSGVQSLSHLIKTNLAVIGNVQ